MMENDSRGSLERWFDGYVAGFDLGSPSLNHNIRLKAEHCKRVAAEIAGIAKSLGLEGRELFLAWTAGLLHDVGRFEQYRRYRTFFDRKSVNHALCGIEVLETQQVLASFPEDEVRLILEAIRYHNGLRVPDGLDERTRRFAQMLRDADKLDIYRVVMEYYRLPREERNETVELDLPDLPAVSDEIVASVRSGKIADYGKLRTVSDFKVLQMGWVYDVNYPHTFRLIRERGYIEQLRDSLPKTGPVEEAYRTITAYLAKRCE